MPVTGQKVCGGGGVVVWCYTHTMLNHLELSTFMFHRVVLPKNGVQFRQQFNGDDISSLAMLYSTIRHRTIILVIKLKTINYLLIIIYIFGLLCFNICKYRNTA